MGEPWSSFSFRFSTDPEGVLVAQGKVLQGIV